MLSIIFQSLGGLGLFLFGIKIMSEGLQKVAGNKMRQILGIVSNNRLIGCGTGALATCVIQSSSVTTVMLVGFVDAGLISFTQAMGVILGANVGTTITAQLIAFKIQDYALPAIAFGVFLKFFVKRNKSNYFGDVLLGFGLVFFGLSIMKTGFAPLKDDPGFIALFTKFDASDLKGILLCVMVGSVLTMLLQSSSATVGVTMVLASQGLLNLEASVALILGENIGTTITAELASIGASLNAHRTARAHTLFNVIGVSLIIIIFPLFIHMVEWVTSSLMFIGPPDITLNGEYVNISRYIANSHTIFNIVNAMFFLMVLPYLVKLAILLTPQSQEEKDIDNLRKIKFLDSRYIETPSVALSQARSEVIRMGESVLLMYDDIIKALKTYNIKDLSKWKKQEDAIDNLQKEITRFLIKIMQNSFIPEQSKEVASLMRMTNNLERIGDAIENIAQLGEELAEQNLKLSAGGIHDYEIISDEVRKFINLVMDYMRRNDHDIMSNADKIENTINQMREEMRSNNHMRLQSGICTVDPGLMLMDMLTAFEKIGDYCYNIAEALAGIK